MGRGVRPRSGVVEVTVCVCVVAGLAQPTLGAAGAAAGMAARLAQQQQQQNALAPAVPRLTEQLQV